MKNALNTPVAEGITRRDGLMLTLLGSALTMAGCGGGGGGGVAGVGSGGTGSFSAGPITGFGSIMVGLTRYEDSTASSILDIDDDNKDLRGQLKLGMMVRVKGKPKKLDRADADDIEVRSELLGPIDSIPSPQTTPPTFVVLGQTVQISTTTVFDDVSLPTGLPALAVGNIVEVHGFVDPQNNRLSATRIEVKLPPVKAFKLQGTVSAFDANAKTFKIGTLTVSFATSVNTPASLVLANGLLVRIRLAITPNTGTRTALKIRAVEVEVEDRDEAEVHGTITAFTSSSKFSVNGVPVDASGASVPAGLKLGDRVEVEGRLVKGVLLATQVKLEDDNDQLKFELHGIIGSLILGKTTFVLRGVTIDFNGSVAFLPAGKTAANLANGASVEVKGVASADGTKVKATRITFE